MRMIHYDDIFHGQRFIDNQITKVFRIKMNDLNIETLNLQKEEVESVMWMDLDECEKNVENNTMENCIYVEELEMLK